MAFCGSPEPVRSSAVSIRTPEILPAIAPAYLTGEPIPTPVTSWKLILSTREDFPNVAPPSAKAKARKSPTLQAMTARATAQSLKFLFFISSQTAWPEPLSLYARARFPARRKGGSFRVLGPCDMVSALKMKSSPEESTKRRIPWRTPLAVAVFVSILWVVHPPLLSRGLRLALIRAASEAGWFLEIGSV